VEAGDPLAAAGNLAGSLVLGLVACYLGLALGRGL
jgi:fluoride ion exporter CrcB/FEX